MYRYRRQIRWLIALLLLAAAVYGGLKGWMYLNVQRAMEEVSMSAVGYAEISYEAIDTELTGSVTLRGVEILPTGSPVPLRIDSARLAGPPLTFFLLGQQSDDDPPPRMRVDIDGIRIDLEPALFNSLRQETVGGAAPARGCGPGDELDPELIRGMGFEQILVSAGMAYDYDKAKRRLDSRMDFDMEGIEQVHASITLENVAPDSLRGEMAAIPLLSDLEVSVRVEPEFGRAYTAACAKRLNLTPDAYRDKRVADTLVQLSRAGLQLGTGLRTVLTDFHRDWGEISLSAKPPGSANLMSLMFNPPADWQQALGLRLRLNQRDIPDLRFDLHKLNMNELAVLMGQEVETAPPRKPAPRYRRVYRPVAVDALEKHLGGEVRLHLRDGQPTRSGILMAVSENEARVEQRLHGGKITAHVQLQDILRAEVEKLEKLPESK